MAKIMLVEDDNNLREIYGARLMAEGFEIVSAADGEEALALAVKQKPDLIVSDVMMPKISGFDMLDILRTTPETKNTKVIMMTALSQPEDRKRGEALGADRYLVKSQVTLEDVVTAVHDVLGDGVPAGASAEGDADGSMVPPVVDTPDTSGSSGQPLPEPPAEPPVADTPVAEPPAPATEPPANEPAEEEPAEPAEEPAVTTEPAPAEEPATEPKPADAVEEPAAPESQEEGGDPPEDPTQAPELEEEPEPTAEDDAPSHKTKVIKPLNDLTGEPDILKLAKEEALREQQTTPGGISTPPTAPGIDASTADPKMQSIASEKKDLESQIKEFVETSEAVNGDPPKQVELPAEPEVGDPNYQPPVAENDRVEIGEPPSDEGVEVPRAAADSPPPPAELPVESSDPLPEPPQEPTAAPKPPVEQAPEPAKPAPSPVETPIPPSVTSDVNPDEVAL